VTRFCNGACNTALKSASAECDATVNETSQMKAMADSLLGHCSGCMMHYGSISKHCDIGDDNNNEDVTRYCNGACNTALKSASAECDATVNETSQIKGMADSLLRHCSGCMMHSPKFDSTCTGWPEEEGSGEDDPFSQIVAMHAVACSGECNALLTAASADCDASIEDEKGIKRGVDDALGFCSGCNSTVVHAFNTCPSGSLEVTNLAATDVANVCSGACKVAILSVSNGCEAKKNDTAGWKNEADRFLGYCQDPVVLTLTASGTPSDYTNTSGIASSIAKLAGVDVSLVTITVEGGSVVITATIAMPPTTTTAAVKSSLTSSLGTKAAASDALGITVEATPTLVIAPYPSVPPPSPPPPLSPASPPGEDAEGESSGSGRVRPSLLVSSFVLGLVVLVSAR
jgi:hypothetical protein